MKTSAIRVLTFCKTHITYDSVLSGQNAISKRDLRLTGDLCDHTRQVVFFQGSKQSYSQI